MPASQRIVQVCLFLIAAISLFGGTLQMTLGQPETTPRLDNVHRFMAGVYFSMGIISAWAAITIRQQRTLVYLIGFGVLMAAIGRLLSIVNDDLVTTRGWAAWSIIEAAIWMCLIVLVNTRAA